MNNQQRNRVPIYRDLNARNKPAIIKAIGCET